MDESLVFDVGCHTGEDSAFYLNKGFRVVAVEANPTLCAQLRQRFSVYIADGKFILIEKAIAEEAGEVEFYMNRQASYWGTIRPAWARRNAAWGAPSEKILVPAIQYSFLVHQFGVPYYLKIDIEGADFPCLEGLMSFDKRPQFVSFEIEHRSFLRREIRLLRKLGYTKFQITDQSAVPAQIAPFPAREGIYVDYRFESGASGLFGKELPEAWLPLREFEASYCKLRLRDGLSAIARRMPGADRSKRSYSTSWYDLHAALTI